MTEIDIINKDLTMHQNYAKAHNYKYWSAVRKQLSILSISQKVDSPSPD